MAEVTRTGPTRHSPLGHLGGGFATLGAASVGALHLTELPFWQQLNLRLDPVGGPIGAAEQVLETALPVVPGTTVRANGRLILWLGPDEWLILSAPDTDAGLESRLRSALAGQTASLVDVSAVRTILQVSGSGARPLLAHGCALDLHPRAFEVGRCAQTKCAQANVVLYRPDADTVELEPVFWILVRASFADYLGRFLLDAAPGDGGTIIVASQQ